MQLRRRKKTKCFYYYYFAETTGQLAICQKRSLVGEAPILAHLTTAKSKWPMKCWENNSKCHLQWEWPQKNLKNTIFIVNWKINSNLLSWISVEKTLKFHDHSVWYILSGYLSKFQSIFNGTSAVHSFRFIEMTLGSVHQNTAGQLFQKVCSLLSCQISFNRKMSWGVWKIVMWTGCLRVLHKVIIFACKLWTFSSYWILHANGCYI